MATSTSVSATTITLPIAPTAAGDLSGKRYYAVKRSADGVVTLAGAGEGLGILMNDPEEGDTCLVGVQGGGRAKIGATVSAEGITLKSDASGKLIPTVAATDRYLAISAEAGATDDVIDVIYSVGQGQ